MTIVYGDNGDLPSSRELINDLAGQISSGVGISKGAKGLSFNNGSPVAAEELQKKLVNIKDRTDQSQQSKELKHQCPACMYSHKLEELVNEGQLIKCPACVYSAKPNYN